MGRSDKAANGPRRRRISVSRVALVLVILVCLAGLWVVWQWRRKPPCWREHDRLLQLPTETLDQMAEQFEKRMLREVSQIGRNGDTATIVAPFDEANAWLLVRLDDWARHQNVSLPKPLGDIVVGSEGGGPVVAFELETEEVHQVFSVAFEVRLPSPGRLAVRVDKVRAGRLPIPVGWVLDHLRKSVTRNAIEPAEKLVSGAPFDAVFDHPGHEGKRLRVVGLELEPDAVAVTLKAEPR